MGDGFDDGNIAIKNPFRDDAEPMGDSEDVCEGARVEIVEYRGEGFVGQWWWG